MHNQWWHMAFVCVVCWLPGDRHLLSYFSVIWHLITEQLPFPQTGIIVASKCEIWTIQHKHTASHCYRAPLQSVMCSTRSPFFHYYRNLMAHNLELPITWTWTWGQRLSVLLSFYTVFYKLGQIGLYFGLRGNWWLSVFTHFKCERVTDPIAQLLS